jgi:hypothetical protein
MENIGIETNSASSGDNHNLNAPAVIGVLLLVLILAAISSRGFRKRGLAVHNLFLKIALKHQNRNGFGFVRSLDLNKMQLVMTGTPTKGEEILFDLSSLSGFPSPETSALGTITKVIPIAGNNNNFLVTVAFGKPSNSNDFAELMSVFLQNLA